VAYCRSDHPFPARLSIVAIVLSVDLVAVKLPDLNDSEDIGSILGET
jgi:hypothetical protein